MARRNDRSDLTSAAQQVAAGRTSYPLLNRLPAAVLVLLAILAIQVGASIAKQLFPVLGPEGTVAARIILSALLLCIVNRKRVSTFAHTFLIHWRLLLAFGFCMAAMNLFFYMAIARIPLGAAVTFEFVGPLSIAALGSRRWSHLGWVALAAIGVALLSPFSGSDLDPLGVLFALTAGAGWALFIVMAEKVGTRTSGNDGLTIGMLVAATVMMPFVFDSLLLLATRPDILLACLGVAVLSTTLPFILEFEALRRLSKRSYGILVSIEPAVAMLTGALLLGEQLQLQGVIAMMCVVVAAIGITVSDYRDTAPP